MEEPISDSINLAPLTREYRYNIYTVCNIYVYNIYTVSKSQREEGSSTILTL